MNSPYPFKPTAKVQFAKSKGELMPHIDENPANRYLYTGREKNPPLKFTRPYARPYGKQFLFVQEEDGLISAVQTLLPIDDPDNVIISTGTSTHPNHIKKGYAKSLIWTAMQHAEKEQKILAIGRFKEDGRKYLTKIYSRLHMQFPNLRICYA